MGNYFFSEKRQEVLIMGGYDGDEVVNEVTKMIVEQDGSIRFEASMPMLHPRCNHFEVPYKGEVLSLSVDCNFRSTVVCYDTSSQKQRTLQTVFPRDVYNVCVTEHKHNLCFIDQSGNIYVLKEHPSRSDHGVWVKHEASTNESRRHSAAISFEGKLYICGGVGKRSIEVFDPATGTWQLEEEKMNNPRNNFFLYIFEEELYAVAGDDYGQNTTIEKRNKATKKWEIVADCGQIREDCAVSLVGSNVFLYGGRYNMFTFDYFDLYTKKWASQDVGCAYYDVATRQLPRPVMYSRAVLITSDSEK